MQDEDLAEIILARFLESAPQQIESLQMSLEAGDAAGARLAAHSLKGAAATVGGERVRGTAFVLEQAAQAGDLRTVGEHLAEVKEQFECLQAAMQTTGYE